MALEPNSHGEPRMPAPKPMSVSTAAIQEGEVIQKEVLGEGGGGGGRIWGGAVMKKETVQAAGAFI